MNIIICENLIDANLYLKKLILENLPADLHKDFDKSVGLVEASIGRMVPVMDEAMQAGNKLRVYVEPYNILPVDGDAFVGEIPKIENMVPFTPFQLFIQRKLFMHNMSHALCAYLGYLAGDKYVYEAAAKPEIKLLALHALIRERPRAFQGEQGGDRFPFGARGKSFISVTNDALKDTVARVGRDTQRKLSPNDRLAGAYRLCAKNGVPNTYICVGIAAALLSARKGTRPRWRLRTTRNSSDPATRSRSMRALRGRNPKCPLSSGCTANFRRERPQRS